MEEIIKALNLDVQRVNQKNIIMPNNKLARGAFRWNYEEKRGEILLAKKATDRTLMHEVGHAANFILGNGERLSDSIDIDSEDFANLFADFIGKCYDLKTKKNI